MPAQVRAGTTLRFGVFKVIPESGELLRAGVRVKLQQQPLQLLVFLLQRPGMIVTREELRAKGRLP